MTVRVYSTDSCPWCVKAKEFLDSLGVAYESVNVSGDRTAAMELVKKTHQMGVPVVQVGEKYIVGYQPDAIKEELKANGLLR